MTWRCGRRVADPRAAVALRGRPDAAPGRGGRAALVGAAPGRESIAGGRGRAVEGLEPPGDMHGGTEYRIDVARAQVRRGDRQALDRAANGEG